ncbi:MAG: Maf-like protein [Gammaproteobacteria bacterium]|nr:Maf-like protein [Gammaproteobacteria bacterium]MCF6363524.1 Maf-like protein [Gammaproteobacteria bacterium]
MTQLVLASTSPFRKALLERLGQLFSTASPKTDETRRPGETADALVKRLSEDKARAVANQFPNALIIGSDQVAVLGDEILGKPGTHERAAEQLTAASGNEVLFLTGLCLLNTATGRTQVEVVPFTVKFRSLTTRQIDNYLRREQPYNCAGSFKSEGLGIALFETMKGEDPNALVGLPLIRLITLLSNEGVDVLGRGCS